MKEEQKLVLVLVLVLVQAVVVQNLVLVLVLVLGGHAASAQSPIAGTPSSSPISLYPRTGTATSQWYCHPRHHPPRTFLQGNHQNPETSFEDLPPYSCSGFSKCSIALAGS
jgi:hypothetical protein